MWHLSPFATRSACACLRSGCANSCSRERVNRVRPPWPRCVAGIASMLSVGTGRGARGVQRAAGAYAIFPCCSARDRLQAPRTVVTSEFRVGMACDGCAGAVKKALAKVDGVSSIETDVTTQHVIVTHAPSATVDALLDALHTWAGSSGKVVAIWK